MIGAIVVRHYETVGILGEGSMGHVYLARCTDQPQQFVVVKQMKAHLARQPRFREMFQREMQTMAAFRHPYVAELIDSSLDDPAGPCLVMEYIPGQTLDAILKQERRLPLPRAQALLDKLCYGLAAAHAAGIVHQDLKPANLMVLDAGTPNESLKILDFGLAAAHTRPHFTLERLQGGDLGSAVGTPAYVCPEQLRGDETDHRADLYSVGVILFEMLTGQLPFDAPTVDEILRMHVEAPPPRLVQMGAGTIAPSFLLTAIEGVIHQCLSKYPVERPQTARELAERFAMATRLTLAPPPKVQRQATRQPMAVATPDDGPFGFRKHLDAWMPEKIAVVKLRGFVSDRGGRIVASEPGLIRVLFREPPPTPPKSAWQGFFNVLTGSKGKPPPPLPDPVELELYMEKRDEGGRSRLHIEARFRPAGSIHNPGEWRRYCEKVHSDLLAYLMTDR